MVQAIIAAVDTVVADRKMRSLGGIDAFAKEGVSGMPKGIIADLVDTVRLVRRDSETCSYRRGNERGRELQEIHAEGLDFTSRSSSHQ